MPETGMQTKPEPLPKAVPVELVPVALQLPQAGIAGAFVVVFLVIFFTTYSFSAQVNVTQFSADSGPATRANITTAMARITALEQNVAGLESVASKLIALEQKVAATMSIQNLLKNTINMCVNKSHKNTDAIEKVKDELKTVSVKAGENPDLEPPHRCEPDDVTLEMKVQGNYVEQFATLAELNKKTKCTLTDYAPQSGSQLSCFVRSYRRFKTRTFGINAHWVTNDPVHNADAFNAAIKTYHLVNVPQRKSSEIWNSKPTERTTLGWAIIRPDALDTGTRVSRDIQSILDNNSDNDDIAQLLSHRLGGSGTNIINVILQTPCINRVSYLQFEMKIYACIKNHNASAIVKFDVKYPSYVESTNFPYRPTEIKYTAWFDRGCESMSMLFLNLL